MHFLFSHRVLPQKLSLRQLGQKVGIKVYDCSKKELACRLHIVYLEFQWFLEKKEMCLHTAFLSEEHLKQLCVEESISIKKRKRAQKKEGRLRALRRRVQYYLEVKIEIKFERVSDTKSAGGVSKAY